MEIKANRKPLAAHVYDAVRAAILSGELAPGSLYSVNTIAERLDVSRTPVREALLILEDQGMVKFERNKGARILATSIDDLLELFSLRILLETASAYQAALKAKEADVQRLRKLLDEADHAYERHPLDTRKHLEPDAAFHKEIAAIAGSKKLCEIIDGLFDQQMIADLTSGGVAHRAEEIVDDHRQIFEAISRGDAKGAANAMRSHLVGSCRALVSKEAPEGWSGETEQATFIDIFKMMDEKMFDGESASLRKNGKRPRTAE